MHPFLSSAQISLALDIHWQSQDVDHHEHFFIEKLNTWRDLDPASILFPITRAAQGETLSIQSKPGEITGAYDPEKVLRLNTQRLRLNRQQLRVGRFYPQGMITGLPGVFKENITPFRLIELDDNQAVVDLNHPLAKHTLDLDIEIIRLNYRDKERGGSCTDWIQVALDGPGIQQRINREKPTRFIVDTALQRLDERPDPLFYQTDRFVPHIDETASQLLAKHYGRLISPGQKVLDLMASWTSHLPETFASGEIHGLGMNANELNANPLLAKTTVQDLNQNPVLPFTDHFFDAVICSLSVEYLIHPVQVFEHVGRVLKPGGVFAVSFSNRWFPEKAIGIWQALHDFERQALVMEYFYDACCFEKLETFSVRGYPRPPDDSYANQFLYSDPLFLVVGRKRFATSQ
ncbi:MAG: SAM-dependent methyltransferase [Deltaproteobacteria bacterium]|nr:MAG: SAM-dependent methyltransferase [Deltaproteobacteria bacterium]